MFFGREIDKGVDDPGVGFEVDGGVDGVKAVQMRDEVVDVDEEGIERLGEGWLGEKEAVDEGLKVQTVSG